MNEIEVRLKDPPAYRPRHPVRSATKLASLQQDAKRKAGYRAKNRIRVPRSLEELHPFVVLTHAALRRAKPDKSGLLQPPIIRALDVQVSDSQVDRAMCILSAFIYAAEAKGMVVKLARREKRRSWIEFEGEQIEFWLTEDIDRTPHKPTKEEKKRLEEWWERRSVPQWDERSSGRIRLRIDGSGTMRSTWSDTTRYRLEDTLDSAIRAVRRIPEERKKTSAAEAEQQRQREEQHRRWQEEEEQRQARRRAAERQVEHANRLRELVRRWKEACDIRAYASAMQDAVAPNGSELLPDSDEARSISWIRAYADRVDPLVPRAGEPPEIELGRNPWASSSLRDWGH